MPCSTTFLSIGQASFLTPCSKPRDCLNIVSCIPCSSSSLEDRILNLNQRLEEFFLLSTHRHEEVTGLIRGLDSRISNLEHKFDKYDEDDDMSQDF